MYVSRALRLGPSRHLRGIGICAAIAVGASLGVLAPPAVAAPANDHFANRTLLAGPLPIEVSESNAGATAEPEELIGEDALDAKRSLWWEWEAPATEYVSIGTCGTEFPTVVGVFTGEAFPPMPADVDLNSGGPDCSSQVVLPAVAGTIYDIGVDGNLFEPPGGPALSGEGTIRLRIAALPPPPNDDFAAATPLTQEIYEFPDGSRRVRADAWLSYNWGATSEPGEPALAQFGEVASVWYRWTAPGSGMVSITGQAGEGSNQVLMAYTGGTLGSLAPVSVRLQGPHSVEFMAEAGREYRITVDGTAPLGGTPWMGDFPVFLSEDIPGPGSSGEPSSPAPATASSSPQTAPQALRVTARRAKKHAKHGCVVHPKRHKVCLARARFDARARHRRQHAAG
jgi:hypothetical protein